MRTLDWPMPEEFKQYVDQLKYFKYYPGEEDRNYYLGSSLVCYLNPSQPATEETAEEIERTLKKELAVDGQHMQVSVERALYQVSLRANKMENMDLRGVQQSLNVERKVEEISKLFQCTPIKPPADSRAEKDFKIHLPQTIERNKAEQKHQAILKRGERLRVDYPMPEDLAPFARQLRFLKYYPELDNYPSREGGSRFSCIGYDLNPGGHQRVEKIKALIIEVSKRKLTNSKFNVQTKLDGRAQVTIHVFASDLKDIDKSTAEHLPLFENTLENEFRRLGLALRTPDEDSYVEREYDQLLHWLTSDPNEARQSKRWGR